MWDLHRVAVCCVQVVAMEHQLKSTGLEGARPEEVASSSVAICHVTWKLPIGSLYMTWASIKARLHLDRVRLRDRADDLNERSIHVLKKASRLGVSTSGTVNVPFAARV